jgi:hypothetical protein
MDAGAIRNLQERLAFPGQEALFKATRKEAQRLGVAPPSRHDVKAATASSSTQQVYARRPHAGTVTAAAAGERWQVDIVSFQSLSATKSNRNTFGVLLAIDVATRKLRGTPVRGKDGPTMAAAFQRIFAGGGPKVVDSDAGGEMNNTQVNALMAQRGIVQQFKDPKDQGGIALIDRATGQFKQAMFRLLQNKNSSVWVDKVDDVLRALNERPHAALGGAAPSDAETSDHLAHLTLIRNTKAQERNHAAHVRSMRGLEPGSKFRAPLKRAQRGFQRGAAQQFSSQVFTVGAILQEGRQVRAQEDGKVYSTKLVLPVSQDSQPAGRALQTAQLRRTAQVRAQRGQG